MKNKRTRKGKVMCIICGKEVKKAHKKWMLAIEKPVRIDLIVHRKCFQKNDENTIKNAVKQHII